MFTILEDIWIYVLIAFILFGVAATSKKTGTFFRIIAARTPTNSIRILLNRLGGTKVGRGVSIGKYCDFSKGVTVGRNVKIGSFVKLGNNVILGSNVVIRDNVYLSKVTIGDRTLIGRGTSVWGIDSEKIKIGQDCSIGSNNLIDGSSTVNIGNNVHTANSVSFWSHSAMFPVIKGVTRSDENFEKGKIKGKISIEDNVWIGGGCTIFPAVSIGMGSAIMPHSVVEKSILPHTISGGNPLKQISKLPNEWRRSK